MSTGNAVTRFDIVGVTIVDGRGGEPFVGDVVIDGDRINQVNPAKQRESARRESARLGARTINGAGLVLAPGFIDVHTHDDGAVLNAPDHAPKTLQGVTSVVVGNCGFSAAPGHGSLAGFPPFERMAEYLDAIDATKTAVNVAALVGHGSIRAGSWVNRTRPRPTRPS